MNAITILQKMKQYFIKKGGKSEAEAIFRKLIKNRGLAHKGQIKKHLLNVIYNATPFVRLKIRKRGKRVRYKITYLEAYRGERKAFLAFARGVKNRTGTHFSTLIEKELEDFSTGKSPILAKRDEFHRLALQNTPYKWSRKKWVKKKRLRRWRWKLQHVLNWGKRYYRRWARKRRNKRRLFVDWRAYHRNKRKQLKQRRLLKKRRLSIVVPIVTRKVRTQRLIFKNKTSVA